MYTFTRAQTTIIPSYLYENPMFDLVLSESSPASRLSDLLASSASRQLEIWGFEMGGQGYMGWGWGYGGYQG